MKNNQFNSKLLTDSELLKQITSYLANLSTTLPSNFLKDTCAGARALLYILYGYFNLDK